MGPHCQWDTCLAKCCLIHTPIAKNCHHVSWHCFHCKPIAIVCLICNPVAKNWHCTNWHCVHCNPIAIVVQPHRVFCDWAAHGKCCQERQLFTHRTLVCVRAFTQHVDPDMCPIGQTEGATSPWRWHIWSWMRPGVRECFWPRLHASWTIKFVSLLCFFNSGKAEKSHGPPDNTYYWHQ